MRTFFLFGISYILFSFSLLSQKDKLSPLPNNFNTLDSLYTQAKEQADKASKYYPDSMLWWSQRMDSLALQIQQDNYQAEAKMYLSEAQFWLGQYDTSVITAERASYFLGNSPYSSLHARLFYRLAEAYEYTGCPELALSLYEKAYEIAESINDLSMLIRLDLKMGDMNKVSAQYENALSFYKKAKARTNNISGLNLQQLLIPTFSYYTLVLKYPELVDTQELDSICTQIHEFPHKYSSVKDSIPNLFKHNELLLLMCMAQSNIHDAQSIKIPTLKEIKQQTTNINGLQLRLNLYAQIALKQSKTPLAFQLISHSSQLADKSENLIVQIDTYKLLKEIAVKVNNYKLALRASELINSKEHKMADASRAKSIKSLENQLEIKEKEHKIALLNKEKELLQQTNALFIFGLSLLALLLFIIWWLFLKSKEKNKIISQQNLSLGSLNTTKDRIFAIIGHDIRRPFMSLKGITQKVNYLIERQDFKRLNELSQEIEHEANSMSKTINNLLSWAVFQPNFTKSEAQKLNLYEATRDVFEQFEKLALAKNITFKQHISKEIYVSIAPSALSSIFRNLLDNALKFTEKGGNIDVYTNIKKEHIEILVQDTGVGMNIHKVQQINMLKHTKSEVGTAGEKGTGLGLYLVRELVKLNNGSIFVSSKKDEGTTIQLTLINATSV